MSEQSQLLDKRKYLWPGVLGAILLPAAIMLIMLWLYNVNINHFVPVGSDEMDYWLEVNTVVRTGFFSKNAGYFGYETAVAKNSFFGAHGPFVLIPYYLYGLVFGWELHSPLIVNAIMLTIAMLIYAVVIKDTKKIFWVGLLTASFSCFSFYYLTAMIEIMFYALSIILAALVIKGYCSGESKYAKKYRVALVILIILSMTCRISNVVFFIPVLVFSDIKKKRHYVFYITGIVLLTGLMYFWIASLSSTFSSGFLVGTIQLLSSGRILEAVKLFWIHFIDNLRRYFDLNVETSIEAYSRYASFVAMVLFTVFAFFQVTKIGIKKRARVSRLYLSNALTLFFIILIDLALYDVYSFRDLRTIAPVLFYTVMVTVTATEKTNLEKAETEKKKRTGILEKAVASILVFSSLFFLGAHKAYIGSHFIPDHGESYVVSCARYDPAATSHWENTVVADRYSMKLLSLEPGLGLICSEIVFEEEQKAKYLFVHSPYDHEDYRLVAQDEYTYLYINVNYL